MDAVFLNLRRVWANGRFLWVGGCHAYVERGVVMRFGYQDFGAVASITITSTIFEFRKHNRVVDKVLLLVDVSPHRTGSFFMKTVLSGRSVAVLKAYKLVVREASR